MLRIIAGWKFKRLHKKIMSFGKITDENWPQFKSLVIECIKMAVKADTGCSDNIIYWNMMAFFRREMDKFAANLPNEYYTDLFVTLSGLSRQESPETWKMIDSLRDGKIR